MTTPRTKNHLLVGIILIFALIMFGLQIFVSPLTGVIFGMTVGFAVPILFLLTLLWKQ